MDEERPSGSLLEAVCFVVLHDLSSVDVLAITMAEYSSRVHSMAWDTKMSDIEGRLMMYSAGSTQEAQRFEVPVLCLMEALEASGFTKERCKIMHQPSGVQQFDGRRLIGRRACVQAALASEELWVVGVPSFPSGLANC